MMHEVMRHISHITWCHAEYTGCPAKLLFALLILAKIPSFCLLVHVICIYSIDIKLQEDPPSNSKFCLSIDIDMERQNIEVDGGSCSFMSMEEMQAVIWTRQDKILMSF